MNYVYLVIIIKRIFHVFLMTNCAFWFGPPQKVSRNVKLLVRNAILGVSKCDWLCRLITRAEVERRVLKVFNSELNGSFVFYVRINLARRNLILSNRSVKRKFELIQLWAEHSEMNVWNFGIRRIFELVLNYMWISIILFEEIFTIFFIMQTITESILNKRETPWQTQT